jgi:hypothetical protein
MKNNFNTPGSIKVMSYLFIGFTPVLLYVVIFIFKFEISKRIIPVLNPDAEIISAPFNQLKKLELTKDNFSVITDTGQIKIDSLSFSSDSVFIFLPTALTTFQVSRFWKFEVFVKQKRTLYEILK